MNEYRKVADFYYFNTKYAMFLDNKNKHFFLRTNGNETYSYLSLIEYINLIDFFTTRPLVMNIEKKEIKKYKIKPKVVIGGSLYAITMPLILLGCTPNKMSNPSTTNTNIQLTDNKVLEYSTILDDKSDEPYEIDTYINSELSNNLYIYDMEYANNYYGNTTVSIEDVKNTIKGNTKITEKYQNLFLEFCDSIGEKYPNIDLRTLNKNMETLEIVECTEEEMLHTAWNINTCGCYVQKENKIYVLKDINLEKGTWDYQTIIHEFCHTMRTLYREEDGRIVKVSFEGMNYNNQLTEEALNTLFSVSLLDYEEDKLGYQLQSNYHRVIMDSIDNYDLSDYITHSCSYYAKKLDEYTGDENKATTMFELIQLQYDDYHSENINLDQSEYYPLYDYLSDIYYKNRINENMSYSEANAVTDELVEKMTKNIPSEYNIDVNHIYNYSKEYFKELGINVKTR